MKLKNIIKSYWIVILTALVISFWLGYFITENIHNQNFTYYNVSISSETIDTKKIDVDFFLDALIKKDGTYSYATVKPNDFFNNNDIEISKQDKLINIKIKAKYFIGSEESVLSYKSLERYEKVMKKVVSFHDEEASVNSITLIDYYNPLTNGIFSLVAGLFVVFILFALMWKKITFPDDKIYENNNIFKHPFNIEFWIKSINSVKKMKIFDMCLISILFALQMLMKFISIPSGFADLGIGLTYLVFAYICLIYGPIWGLIIGFGSDIFGFLIKPTIFHPGYTLQAMLTGFVYGLCLYKTDLRFSKVLICRLIVNILLNGIFGAFLWGSYSKLTFDATVIYMYAVTLPKNIIYLIPQSLLLYGFLKAATPLLLRTKIIPKEVIQ